ncbi:DUF6494 family protein [Methylocella sp.]|uniref:DUF6494 family protein n=1 Tax=Methylocella sp. TaxID=1978226 RepID=UPI003C2A436D
MLQAVRTGARVALDRAVGITSQREIERVVREGKVQGSELKLRMTLIAENAPLDHVVEETIDLR